MECQWTDHLPQDTGKVYGVGAATIAFGNVAQATRDAEERARAEVNKTLQVGLASDLLLESRKSFSYGRTDLTRKIKETIFERASETQLSGLEIIAHCNQVPQRTVYALARLDRQKATTNLEHQIASVDRKVLRFSKVPSSLPRLQQIRQLLPALPLLAERSKLTESLSRVHSSRELSDTSDAELLLQRLSELLDELDVGLRPEGQMAHMMESHLIRTLTDKGLRISHGDSPDLMLEYHVQTQSTVVSGIHFVIAEGDILVREGRGRILNTVTARVKGGSSVSEALARDEAMTQLGDRLGEALNESLLAKI